MKRKLTIAACLVALVALAESTCLTRHYGDRGNPLTDILAATTKDNVSTVEATCWFYSGSFFATKYNIQYSVWWYDMNGQCHIEKQGWSPCPTNDYVVTLSKPKCDATISMNVSMDVWDQNYHWIDRVQCGWLR